jgi:hypothetical protein
LPACPILSLCPPAPAAAAAPTTHATLQVSEDSSSSQDNVTRLAEESQRAVAGIQGSIQSKKKDVLGMLLHHVTNVKLVKE